MKTNSYENKVALVTGGTSGIGKATALAFANAGAKVVVTGRREKEGMEVVAEIKKRGGTASFFKADFAEASDVRQLLISSWQPTIVWISPLTTPVSKLVLRWIKSPRNNTGRSSTSMSGAFSIQ